VLARAGRRPKLPRWLPVRALASHFQTPRPDAQRRVSAGHALNLRRQPRDGSSLNSRSVSLQAKLRDHSGATMTLSVSCGSTPHSRSMRGIARGRRGMTFSRTLPDLTAEPFFRLGFRGQSLGVAGESSPGTCPFSAAVRFSFLVQGEVVGDKPVSQIRSAGPECPRLRAGRRNPNGTGPNPWGQIGPGWLR